MSCRAGTRQENIAAKSTCAPKFVPARPVDLLFEAVYPVAWKRFVAKSAAEA